MSSLRKFLRIFILAAAFAPLLGESTFGAVATKVVKVKQTCNNDTNCTATCPKDRQALSCSCSSAKYLYSRQFGNAQQCRCLVHGGKDSYTTTTVCGVTRHYERVNNACSNRSNCTVNCPGEKVVLGCGCSGTVRVSNLETVGEGCRCSVDTNVKVNYTVVAACADDPSKDAKPELADLGNSVISGGIAIQNLGDLLNRPLDDIPEVESPPSTPESESPSSEENPAPSEENTKEPANLGSAIQSYGNKIVGQEKNLSSLTADSAVNAIPAGASTPIPEGPQDEATARVGGGPKPPTDVGGDWGSLGGSSGAAKPSSAYDSFSSMKAVEVAPGKSLVPDPERQAASKTPNAPTLQPLSKDELFGFARDEKADLDSLFARVSRCYRKVTKERFLGKFR
ncbi:MAG TPA: hypothetical protein VIH99_11175 [Bdellovibrionota bacterium]|jgi:hypothetical protein